MQTAIDRFLKYLTVERNSSALTVKSYREDLHALAAYLIERYQSAPQPGDVTTLDLRGYLAALHGGSLRCAASFASGSEKAGAMPILPSPCGTRGRVARCRTSFPRPISIGC
jgi:hypothetical protein